MALLELEFDPVVRMLALSPELTQLFAGPWPDDTIARRIGRLRGDLEEFVKGEEIQVSLEPFEHRNAYMGRLDPPKDSVWEIRSRDPKPGLRVFGRFAERDCFVAITCAPRSINQVWLSRTALQDRHSLEYQINIIECLKQWEHLFPDHAAVKGDDVHEYLTNFVVV